MLLYGCITAASMCQTNRWYEIVDCQLAADGGAVTPTLELIFLGAGGRSADEAGDDSLCQEEFANLGDHSSN